MTNYKETLVKLATPKNYRKLLYVSELSGRILIIYEVKYD